MFEKLDSFAMSKRAIARLFKVAIVLEVAGAVSATAIVIVGLATGVVAFGGAQLVTINPGPFAAAVIGLIIASLLSTAGTIAAIGSWAAALINTARLEDKSWFVALLGLGLISFGWVAMVAYVLKGPDGTQKGPDSTQAVATSAAV